MSRPELRFAPRTRQLLGDYVELTKPKVQSLLLLTTIATMYVAGDPSPLFVALTCLGGYLSAGGAGAVNHWFDRDIDAQNGADGQPAVPSGRVSPSAALTFGCTLAALSLMELSLAVNPLAAALSFAGFLGYVFVYTVWLKRRTPQNIVIGGAAGAVPPLVGWAAVTDSVSGTALILFFIVFFWTPPHFWALSLLMKNEYKRVGVPMLRSSAVSGRPAGRSCCTRCSCTPSPSSCSAAAGSGPSTSSPQWRSGSASSREPSACIDGPIAARRSSCICSRSPTGAAVLRDGRRCAPLVAILCAGHE